MTSAGTDVKDPVSESTSPQIEERVAEEENKEANDAQAEEQEEDAAGDGGSAEVGATDVSGQTGDKQSENTDLYQSPLPNRVIVSIYRALQFYVDRSRRILRVSKDLKVIARGGSISVACTLVEVLKRQSIANIVSVRTEMTTNPIFDDNGEAFWRRPISQITFQLERGEFATYVSDYHQRKVIEIFEKQDPECSGVLSFDQMEKLDLENAFKADDEQRASAAVFRSACPEQQLNLPEFIKYCSVLIHPLLRDRVFKEILSEKFGIATERVERRRRDR